MIKLVFCNLNSDGTKTTLKVYQIKDKYFNILHDRNIEETLKNLNHFQIYKAYHLIKPLSNTLSDLYWPIIPNLEPYRKQDYEQVAKILNRCLMYCLKNPYLSVTSYNE